MGQLDIREIRLVRGRNNLFPENARLHHIMLFHRADLVLARTCQFKGYAGNALDLERVIYLRVDAALLPIAEVDDFLRLTEIHAASQLAHDENVYAFNDLLAQRGGACKRWIADCG